MNFRSILSKSSLRSSSISGKSTTHYEEVSKLHTEIELLKHTVESLKVSLESREAAIGTLAREKEKLYVELKSTQRTNRNLHQQLVDERDIHSKEKEYLIEEIKRLPKTEDSENIRNMKTCVDNKESNHSWKEEIKAKDEVICNICAKYLKIKSSKKRVQQKLESLQSRSQKACENIILLLQENRHTLDNLLNKLVKSSSLTPNSKQFIKLLKINANLHYKNTQLKIYLSQVDFPDEEMAITEKESYESINPKKNSKSEPKFKYTNRQVRHRSRLCSRPSENVNDGETRSFKNVYSTFSPYFRRKIYRFNSEPCLVRF